MCASSEAHGRAARPTCRAGGGEHLRAQVPGQLDRGHPDAAGRRVDQHRLAGLSAGQVAQARSRRSGTPPAPRRPARTTSRAGIRHEQSGVGHRHRAEPARRPGPSPGRRRRSPVTPGAGLEDHPGDLACRSPASPGYMPSAISTSRKFSPAARTATRTWPAASGSAAASGQGTSARFVQRARRQDVAAATAVRRPGTARPSRWPGRSQPRRVRRAVAAAPVPAHRRQHAGGSAPPASRRSRRPDRPARSGRGSPTGPTAPGPTPAAPAGPPRSLAQSAATAPRVSTTSRAPAQPVLGQPLLQQLPAPRPARYGRRQPGRRPRSRWARSTMQHRPARSAVAAAIRRPVLDGQVGGRRLGGTAESARPAGAVAGTAQRRSAGRWPAAAPTPPEQPVAGRVSSAESGTAPATGRHGQGLDRGHRAAGRSAAPGTARRRRSAGSRTRSARRAGRVQRDPGPGERQPTAAGRRSSARPAPRPCRAASSRAGCRPNRSASRCRVGSGSATSAKTSSPRRQAARSAAEGRAVAVAGGRQVLVEVRPGRPARRRRAATR